MNKILFSGIKQSLFEVDITQQRYNNYGEMIPYLPQKYMIRASDEHRLLPDYVDIGWNYEVGLFIYGKKEDINIFWPKLQSFLISTLNEEEENLENPFSYCLFHSPNQDIACIVSHGDYEVIDDQLQSFLESQENIYFIPVDNDSDPFGVVIYEEYWHDYPYIKDIINEVKPYREKCDFSKLEHLPHVKNIKLR